MHSHPPKFFTTKSSLALCILITGLGGLNQAWAVCTANANVTTSCTTLILTNAGDITISAPATITDTTGSNSVFNNLGTTTSLTNLGTITGSFAIDNVGTITTLTNSGTITAVNGAINNNGTIGTLTNSGAITSTSSYGIFNFANITNFTNSGTTRGSSAVGLFGFYTQTGVVNTLTNSLGGLIAGGGGIDAHGNIVNLTNDGTISGLNGEGIWIGSDTPVVVTTIINNGTITGTTNGIRSMGGIGTLTNGGTITSTRDSGIENIVGGTIGTLTNSGTITSTGFYGISNNGTIGTLSNSGRIEGLGSNRAGVANTSTITTLNNSGIITGASTGINNNDIITTINNNTLGTITGGDYGIYNAGTITTLTNSGTIEGTVWSAAGIRNDGTIGTLTNNGTITGTGWAGIYNIGTIGTLTNSGTITGSGGITNASGSIIGTLTNSGTITGSGGDGIYNNGTITTLTNSGTITSDRAGIYNNGTITTLNNLQGAGNANGALTYYVKLPTNYNIIITGANTFGKLSATSATGTTTFGIYAGSTITSRLYSSVLQGLSKDMVSGGTTGTYDGMTYTLTERVTTLGSELWDLGFTGFNAAGTQAALAASAYALRGVYNLQTATINNGLNYDCTVFDTHGVCISVGGRYTSTDSPGTNNGNALVVASYNLTDHVRVGGYLDQNISNSTPTGIKLNNGSPLAGLFGVWNEHKSGEGLEVRVAAGYGDKDLTVTRSAIGTSEAGVGKSQLTSQAVSTTVSYGTALASNWMVSPYAGVRYTRIKAGRYTEGSSADVTAPLTYDALVQQSTTALAGVRFSGRASPKTLLTMSAGVEQDTNNVGNSYNASGVTGLTPITFNSNIQKTRAVANAGIYYDITNTQRIGLNAMYRQEAFQSTNTVTALVTYQVGL